MGLQIYKESIVSLSSDIFFILQQSHFFKQPAWQRLTENDISSWIFLEILSIDFIYNINISFIS